MWLLYSDFFKNCCSVLNDSPGYILFPGMLVSMLFGGGVHGTGPIAFGFGVAIEIFLVWLLVKHIYIYAKSKI